MAPPPRFFVLSIDYLNWLTGLKLIVTTDKACHLWMRWSLNEPWMHPRTEIRRGMPRLSIPYYCFTAYEDNEQEEAGDTLIHTFIKPNWPVCQTRYFYFHGTITGINSPSTTAVFKKHRLYAPEEHEITIDAHPHTGYNRIVNADWDTCHNWDPAGFLAGVTFLYCESIHWAGTYRLSRNVLRFDTTPIPAAATIVDVKLLLWPTRTRDYANSFVYIVYTSSYHWASGSPHQFHDLLDFVTPVVTPFSATDFPDDMYSEATFNALGRSMIHNADPSPGPGMRGTVIPIRMMHDALDIPPGLNATSGGQINLTGSQHANPPKLYVKYYV